MNRTLALCYFGKPDMTLGWSLLLQQAIRIRWDGNRV